MKRGRPKTPTPSASTERSRKSRERAARKPRKEKIIDKHMAYLGPRHFALIPQPTEPITVELSLRLGQRPKGDANLTASYRKPGFAILASCRSWRGCIANMKQPF
jgi:hypothetical protein